MTARELLAEVRRLERDWTAWTGADRVCATPAVVICPTGRVRTLARCHVRPGTILALAEDGSLVVGSEVVGGR